jgi:hypothetical protein
VCVVVAANLASIIFRVPPDNDFIPVLEWFTQKGGCLVYGGKLADELWRIESARRFVRVLQQAGRAILIEKAKLEIEEMNLSRAKLCQSNDLHVIALARVSGARTLCSHDTVLHKDFKNPRLISKPRGSVYQNARHKRLLRHTSSCQRGKKK